MKIVRLKRGYRIHLSDGEMEALRHLLMLGKEDIVDDPEGQLADMSPAGRRAMSTTFAHVANELCVLDDDRRHG